VGDEHAGRGRSWGDGGGDSRAHVIEDISYSQGYLVCRCGVRATGNLEVEWDAHRGLSTTGDRQRRRAYSRATDAEVRVFLREVAGEFDPAIMLDAEYRPVRSAKEDEWW
jgi:hypothetical protein